MIGGSRRPAARTSAARDMLDAAEVFAPGARAAIRARIPAQSLEALDTASSISWLEVEHDHWLMDATLAHFGRTRAVACWRQAIATLIERPLLKSFAEPALRLFGRQPGRILQFVPRGWGLAYRDFCAPSFELTGPGRAVIRFEQVAPEAFASVGYLHCWHAICQGVFDLECPRNGRLDFEPDEARARAQATFRWDE